MKTNLGKIWEMPWDTEAGHAAVHGIQRVGHDWVTEQKQQSARLILSNSKNWSCENSFYIEFKHSSFFLHISLLQILLGYLISNKPV